MIKNWYLNSKSVKRYIYSVSAGFLLLLNYSCGGKNTSSNVTAPGAQKTVKDEVLNTGAKLMQDKFPLKKFNTYLDGFHFYNVDPDANAWEKGNISSVYHYQ